MLQGKLERALSFRVGSDKITVWPIDYAMLQQRNFVALDRLLEIALYRYVISFDIKRASYNECNDLLK